jgi:N-acetylmuramoyl-L-alanine amidase
MNLDSTYILGTADPGYALYLDGKPVSLTKKGYFSVFRELKDGGNKFTFTQNGIDTVYTIYHISNNNTVPAKTWSKMDSFKIKGLIPSNDYMLKSGESISLQVNAPSGSTVTATLNGVSVILKQTTFPPDNANYMEAVYSALYKLPDVPEGQIKDLGAITYKAARGSETANATGVNVKVMNATAVCALEVIKDDSELKVATDSWYYDDYTPAVTGMRDNAVRLSDGYYNLRMGGYIRADDVKVISGKISASAWITSADVLVKDNMTKLFIKTAENVPLNGYIKDGKFVVTLYNVNTDVKNVKFNDNPLFTSASIGKGPQDKSYNIYLTLVDSANFYGFEFSYKDGYVIVSFRNPSILAEGDLPLAGRTIIVDAGHGGTETGALGPRTDTPEKVINLKIALDLASRLEKYGAKVILTRSDDSTVLINDRMDLLNKTEPDMSIAIHLNSMTMSSDITKIRGLIGLYFADAGKLLTGCISASTAGMLNRMERTPTVQRLAMVRNPKFPSTLIEVGFMSSVEEYNVMTGEAGISNSAAGIAKGVLDYYRSQEKFIK